MTYKINADHKIGYEYISSFPYDRGQLIRIFWIWSFKIVVKFIYRFNRRDNEQAYIACLFFKFIDVVSGRLIGV